MDINKILFKSKDYRTLLAKVIHSRPNNGWGEKSRLSEAVSCQVAYVSRVLSGKADFSIEQCEKAASYFGFDEIQTHYFLLLFQENRAGTQSLKTYFESQRKKILKENQKIRNRVEVKNRLPDEVSRQYYSSWQYGAVHVMATIPGKNSASKVASALGIEKSQVQHILNFLVDSGILKMQENEFIPANGSVHIDSDHPLILQQHSNWRLKILHEFQKPTHFDPKSQTKKGFHYSAAMTLSRADVENLKEMLRVFLARSNKLISKSASEEAYGMCIDFFDLTVSQK